jgi:hypothetical protein
MKITVESSGKYLTAGAAARATRLFAVIAASFVAMSSACTSQSPAGPVTLAGTGAPAMAGSGAPVTAGTGAPAAMAGAQAISTAGASAAGSSAVAPIAGTSGAAAGAAAPGGGATFTAVLAIFADPKNNCGLCHKNMISVGVNFDPADKEATYKALVGVASKGMLGSLCGGKTYVVPMQPDASLLYNKLAMATPPCGVRMPASGVVLSDMEIATVRAWIAAGALNN